VRKHFGGQAQYERRRGKTRTDGVVTHLKNKKKKACPTKKKKRHRELEREKKRHRRLVTKRQRVSGREEKEKKTESNVNKIRKKTGEQRLGLEKKE